MLYIFSKVFGFFIQPFNVILVLALISVLLKHEVWKKRLRIAAIGLFILFSNGILLNECLLLWEKPATSLADLHGEYAYAIVLGGTVDMDREPRDRLFFHKGADRVTHTINLYKAGKVKKVVFTGGNPRLFEDPTRDNSPLSDFYIMCGVAQEDIIIESSSRNTRENALLVKEMLEKEKPGDRVILVTSAFHMRRSEACFRRVGLDVTGFSTDFYSALPKDRFGVMGFVPSAQVLVNWNFLIKEWIGYISYKVVGYV
jgi:uncharacterized SAM-binding protein YcdF (DUF218 family)